MEIVKKRVEKVKNISQNNRKQSTKSENIKHFIGAGNLTLK
jgi:hypothetical protein